MSCECCIELMTPKSVLEETETDVFEEIFDLADGVYVNEEVMKLALWHYLRIRCIGSCNLEEWMQAMADRLDLVGPKWDAVISKTGTTDLTESHGKTSERIIRRTAIENTLGDESTETATGSNANVTEDEDLPQTVAGSAKYLRSRVTVTDTPGVTRTAHYKPNTQDTETYVENLDVASKVFSQMMQSYPLVLYNFARDFDDYFIKVLPC